MENQPIYESLSDDEADKRDAEQTTTGSTVNTTKTNKRKRSRVWATFDLLSGDGIEKAKCKKCDYVCGYDSKHGTGNMLKHQKLCQNTTDIRQMVISSSQGSMSLHNGSFDPKIDQLHRTLKAFFDLYKDRIPRYTVFCEDVHGTSNPHQGSDIMKEFDALDDEFCDHAMEKTELDRYLEEKRLNRNVEIDILDYWKTNQYRFPNLALMARDILSIPISTVASESAFSIGGRVLDQYRSSLAHIVVESLVCTRDWKYNAQVIPDYKWEDLTEDIMTIVLDGDAPPPTPSTDQVNQTLGD